MVLRGPAVSPVSALTPRASEETKHPSEPEGARGVSGEAWHRVARNVECPKDNHRLLRCTHCDMAEELPVGAGEKEALDWYDRFTLIHAHLPRSVTSTSTALYALARDMRWALEQLEGTNERKQIQGVLAVYRAAVDQVYRLALRIDAQAEAVAAEVGVG